MSTGDRAGAAMIGILSALIAIFVTLQREYFVAAIFVVMAIVAAIVSAEKED